MAFLPTAGRKASTVRSHLCGFCSSPGGPAERWPRLHSSRRPFAGEEAGSPALTPEGCRKGIYFCFKTRHKEDLREWEGDYCFCLTILGRIALMKQEGFQGTESRWVCTALYNLQGAKGEWLVGVKMRAMFLRQLCVQTSCSGPACRWSHLSAPQVRWIQNDLSSPQSFVNSGFTF